MSGHEHAQERKRPLSSEEARLLNRLFVSQGCILTGYICDICIYMHVYTPYVYDHFEH
jgi:hypothetical protein